MRGNRHLSLRVRTTLIIVCLMIAMMLVLIVGFSLFFSATLVEKATNSMLQSLHLVSQKLDMLTLSVEDSAVFMLANDNVQQWLKMQRNPNSAQDMHFLRREMASYLVNVSRSDHITNVSLFLYGEDANKYAILPYTDPGEAAFMQSFYASPGRNAWNLSRPFIHGGHAMNAGYIPYAITYYHKVYDKWTMEPLGVLAIMVSEVHIAGLYEGIVLGETGYCYIRGKDDVTISSADKSMLGKYTPVETNVSNHVAVRIPYEKLGWSIAGIAPRGEITKDNQILLRLTFLIGVVLILAGVGVSGIVAGRISRPIVQLKGIVLGNGTEAKSLEESLSRSDEIGSLYRAFFRMTDKNEELTRKSIEDSVRQKEYELSLLQAQLNPHFLYNSLECICGLSITGKNEEVVKATTELALFYRGVLSEKKHIVPISKEMEMVRRYFNIIQYRFPGKLNYKIICDDAVQNKHIVKLSVQPIVENAVLHGLRNSRRAWEIIVRAYLTEDGAEVSVWDNGVGMTQMQIETAFNGEPLEQAHFGLSATNNRIQLAFGQKYGLEVFSEPGEGTYIVIKLPFFSDTEGEGPHV